MTKNQEMKTLTKPTSPRTSYKLFLAMQANRGCFNQIQFYKFFSVSIPRHPARHAHDHAFEHLPKYLKSTPCSVYVLCVCDSALIVRACARNRRELNSSKIFLSLTCQIFYENSIYFRFHVFFLFSVRVFCACLSHYLVLYLFFFFYFTSREPLCASYLFLVCVRGFKTIRKEIASCRRAVFQKLLCNTSDALFAVFKKISSLHATVFVVFISVVQYQISFFI